MKIKTKHNQLLNYSRTCPCDHLKIADTHFQSLQFSDSNARSVFLKMDHLRNANCGHRKSAQSFDSTWEKWPNTSNWAKNTFSIVQLFPRKHFQMSDHRVCKLDLAWSLPITPPHTCGNYRSLMTMARTGACVRLYYWYDWKLLNQAWQMRPPEK